MINYSDFTKPEDLKRLKYIVDVTNLKVPFKGRILDIGCGIGNICRQLGYYEYDLIGIDSDVKSIELAKSKNSKSNVKYFNVDVYQYLNDEKFFNAVICSEVLEHLIDPESIIKLAHKILRDDGVFVVTVPNGNGPRELFVTRPIIWIRDNSNILWKILSSIKIFLGYKGETIHSKSENLEHLHFFTLKKLHLLADNNGFKMIDLRKSNFISGVFPFSLVYKRSLKLQALDCWIADKLPNAFTSGFFTIWVKKNIYETTS